MDAPVYRHAESRATLLGLNFPTDFFVVVVLSYLWLLLLAPAALRPRGGRNAPGDGAAQPRPASQYWPHWLAFQLRKRLYGGHLSAAARSRAPQFPHGPYRSTRSAEGLS